MSVVPVSAMAWPPGSWTAPAAPKEADCDENCQKPLVVLMGAHCMVPLNLVESMVPNS